MPGRFCVLSLLFVLVPASLSAQDFRAKLTGTVSDPSGAPVAGVQVTLTGRATGIKSTTDTNSSGAYLFPFLNPGEYSIAVAATGFKTSLKENLILQTGQVANVDVQLEIGDTQQSISVTAEAALLDTQSATRGAVVNEKLIQELPIVGRVGLLYANLLPGTTFRGAAVFRQPFANSAIAAMAINGGQQTNNEFLLDGAPNNARAGGQSNNVALVPVNESVQEVSVVTNLYDASFGKTSGGVINIITRSGGSEHHLAGWGFLRKEALNANLYVNNGVGAGRPPQDLTQWGFQASGPIPIRKLKLFYLGTYERYTELQPAPLSNSFPTAEMRQGDFSRLTNPVGAPIVIFDPFTSTLDSGGNPVRQPFPDNRIPTSRIHPVAAKVTTYMPQVTSTGLPGQRYAQGSFPLPNYSYNFNFYNLAGRVDAHFGDNDRVYFRYATNKHTQLRTLNGIFNSPGENAYNPFLRQNHAYLFDYVRTINPSTVLNLRANYARYVEGSDTLGNFNFDPQTLGLPASLVGQLATPDFFGIWTFGNYSQLGGNLRSMEYNNNYSLLGTLAKTLSNHNIKLGADVRRLYYLPQNVGAPLQFNSNAAYTRQSWNLSNSEATSGDGYASFLLGAIASGQADYQVLPHFGQWYIAPFFQDDWKVSRRLSLNLGLRYDINTTPDERHNRLVTGFDKDAPSPIASKITPAMLELYPNLRNLRGGLTFAGLEGNRTTASNTYHGAIQPRAGVAFQITNRVVVRGGYGMFFANWPDNNFLQTQGFSNSTSLIASLDGGRTPTGIALTNPYPGGIAKPVGSSLGLNTFAGRTFPIWNPNARMPRVQQFSFGFQLRTTASSLLDLSYVGSRTTGLITSLAANIPSDAFAARCDLNRGGSQQFCNELLPNPFQGLTEFAGTNLGTAAMISRYQLNRPFPQFESDLTEFGRKDGKSWYNSMQADYRVRLKEGLVILANYTLAKQIEQSGWLNQFAQIPQRSLVPFDRTHQAKFTAHYELPFGTGKRFGAASSRMLNRIVGGWDVNGFYTMATGEPADLPGNAIMLRDPRVKVDRNQFRVRGWNACVLQINANGSFTPVPYSVQQNGCSATDFSSYDWAVIPQGMNTFSVNPSRSGNIRMPRTWNLDLSVNKTVAISERLRFQFRAEAFNATNHFNVWSVRYATNPLDPNFGTYFPVNTASFAGQVRDTQPRSIQLGFRLLW